jgi:hypothetical protein
MNAVPERRFPAPWTVEELDARFVVIDNSVEKAKQLELHLGQNFFDVCHKLARLALCLCQSVFSQFDLAMQP